MGNLTNNTVNKVRAARAKNASDYRIYDIPEVTTVPENEQIAFDGQLSVTNLVTDIRQEYDVLPINDLIVERMDEELIDIEAKLAAIAFLKTLEKPLKKRASVIYKFKAQLEEAHTDLVDAGEKELKVITKNEAKQLNAYIQDDNLDKIIEESDDLVAVYSSEKGGNLNDFV